MVMGPGKPLARCSTQTARGMAVNGSRAIADKGTMQTTRARSLFVVVALIAAFTAGLVFAGRGQAAAPPSGDAVPGQVLVRYLPGTGASDQAAAESQVGATLRSTIDDLGVRVLGVAPDHRAGALNSLSRNPHVEYVEQDATAHATAITP